MKMINENDTVAKKRFTARTLILGILIAALVGGTIGMIGMNGTLAYLSHKPAGLTNKFTVGNVTIDIQEDFRPPTSMPVGATTYKKEVKFKNTGTVNAYARVNFAFSNTDVANLSQISSDGGNTWYSLSEFKTHLPSGWAYKQSGILSGYYYYTSPLTPGASTTPLFTHVKTTFQNKTADTNQTINKTPRDYDIYVYAEGLQQMKLNGSGKHTNYETAWTQFLNLKK